MFRARQWHPSKPAIASTTKQGNILIWHCPTPERWGAFAGGFEEVDENVEYEERLFKVENVGIQRLLDIYAFPILPKQELPLRKGYRFVGPRCLLGIKSITTTVSD